MMKTMKFGSMMFLMLAAISLVSCGSDDVDEDNTISYVQVYYSLDTSQALRDQAELTFEWFGDEGERKKNYIQSPGTIALRGSVYFHELPAHWGFRITPRLKADPQTDDDGPLTYTATMKPTIHYASGRTVTLSETVSTFYAENSYDGWYSMLQFECRQTGLVQSIDKNGKCQQDANYVW